MRYKYILNGESHYVFMNRITISSLVSGLCDNLLLRYRYETPDLKGGYQYGSEDNFYLFTKNDNNTFSHNVVDNNILPFAIERLLKGGSQEICVMYRPSTDQIAYEFKGEIVVVGDVVNEYIVSGVQVSGGF
ncbi:MAG: hypothetical protein K0T99_00070 [Alphaproteobacteria bacterium]|nr:hypothetical protein [Alphaproteobacteria bacterium]